MSSLRRPFVFFQSQVAGPAGQTLRTSFSAKTVQDSEHPVWNETGQIQLESGDQRLEFQVWDKDQTKDELLGKAALNCRRLRLGKPLETNVKLTGVHAAGSVRVRVRVLKKHDTIFSQCCCGR
ncbi:unnamed protein product [Effrenium voratum]|nr:unnamed protein product [Effrenium voratum]